MSARWRFRPGFVVTVATIAFCALTVALGMWQTRRAAEKESLQATLDLRAAEPPLEAAAACRRARDAVAMRRIAARGEYAERFGILLDNKVHRGPRRLPGRDAAPDRRRRPARAREPRLGRRPGARATTLPRVAGARRGRRPSKASRSCRPRASTSSRPTRRATPSGSTSCSIAIARGRGSSSQPFVIQQTNDAGDGLVREWDRPDTGVDRHRSYALQWFALAMLAVVLYVVLNFKRRPSAA